MGKPRLLDLFSGAGGAAMGYYRAGFYVVGVDICPQPRYAGDEFIQADAMTFPLDGFDAVHASPPCQAYTSLRAMQKRAYPELLEPTRRRLTDSGLPWIIENVERAPMQHGLKLCGTMFGLPLLRHRRFDSSHWLAAPGHCRHEGAIYGVYGNHCWRNDVRAHSAYRDWNGTMRRRPAYATRAQGRAAMGIDWMNWHELTQAIPPAYTHWLGLQLRHIILSLGSRT